MAIITLEIFFAATPAWDPPVIVHESQKIVEFGTCIQIVCGCQYVLLQPGFVVVTGSPRHSIQDGHGVKVWMPLLVMTTAHPVLATPFGQLQLTQVTTASLQLLMGGANLHRDIPCER